MQKNVDLWAKVYRWNAENRNYLVYPDEELVRIVKKSFVPRGVRRVLDLGCGSGRHTLMLLTEGFDVTGMDSSTEGIEIAREMTESMADRRTLQVADATRGIPFEDGAFDAVVCWGVLHYLSVGEADAVLAEVRRVLKPGGGFALTLRSSQDSECPGPGGRPLSPGTGMHESTAPESEGMAFHYFDKKGVRARLKDFSELVLGHKTRTLLGDTARRIAHWFVYCRSM